MENSNYTSSQPGGAEIRYMPLEKSPPPHRWDDWVEYESAGWPQKREKHFAVVPTTCRNCESACGLLAFVDKESGTVARMEGNPYHPASRGRLCAMGPATVNQITDPERILHPLKRLGKRGEGKWERISWEQALREISTVVRPFLLGGRRDELLYHTGGSGGGSFPERVFQAWGMDCRSSQNGLHSSGRRLGSVLWHGHDRSSPDYANARFILLLGAPLESGDYLNPHAQRILEAKMQGTKIAVVDACLSNTASKADYWLAPIPGTEAALLLAMAHVLIEDNLFDADFVRRWTNWRQFMLEGKKVSDATFETFLNCLRELYSAYSPQFAGQESGLPPSSIVEIARQIGRAGSAFASHCGDRSTSGGLGGWQVARALGLLHVLTGSVGTPGGIAPAGWNKFIPEPFARREGGTEANKPSWPGEYPPDHSAMNSLLPYFLKEGTGRVGAYFTRACNPVNDGPGGLSWVEVLRDEQKIGLHVALTPVWNETARLADYVLPMGFGGEQHDLLSRETHAGLWIGFGQPVVRVARERSGESFEHTYQANPGEVWEEDEFWLNLSWRLDPDGSLGMRRYFESPYRPGEKITVEEHYRWIFENGVPGLPERAAGEGLSPLEFMRKYGAIEIIADVYNLQEARIPAEKLTGSRVDEVDRVVVEDEGRITALGTFVDGHAVAGFATPSRRLEIFSMTAKEWGWAEYALPGYIPSHAEWRGLDAAKGEFILIPAVDPPTLVRGGTGNAKWLAELSHSNPLWIHTRDAARLKLHTGDLIRVATDAGYFVTRVWVTEGIRPGVIACSRPTGNWSVGESGGRYLWDSVPVSVEERTGGIWFLRRQECNPPFVSQDSDSERIWWAGAGTFQNLALSPHPDPVSGVHCWHQKVFLEAVTPEDRFGDVCVDTTKILAVTKEWLGRMRCL